MSIESTVQHELFSGRVLIVEDQPAVAKALRLLLEVHDIPVAVAGSPDEALALVQGEEFGVLIQDMNFVEGATSGEDGLALFRRIREIDPTLPVLALTAWTSLEVAVQMVKEGASDYMAKPWNDQKLVLALKKLLQTRALARENERRMRQNDMRKSTIMRRGDVLSDRFVIERFAGAGGMGEVYQGLDRRTGQPIAVKVLRGDGANDIARFEREARILRGIDDPRVVRHIAEGAAPTGDPYLVMEWLDGEDLSCRLARGRLGLGESVALCTSIADALGMLHDRGIIHRDLKPNNIFLEGGRTDQIKLLDFGIAWARASTRVTATGMLVGTLGYMAPELGTGNAESSERTDVYSLGCVLFECIVGEPAFSGTNPMVILTKVLIEEAPRLKALFADVPDNLDELVHRWLSKRHQERPANGRAAAEALRALGDMPNRTLERKAG